MTMNKLCIIGVLFLLVYWGLGCQDIPIGYLQTEDAGYNPDTMVIKNENSLDDYPGEPNPEFQMYLDMGYTAQQITEWFGIPERINAGEDYVRSKWGAPWVSTPIEGVQGTAQIYVSIKAIREESGGSVTEALEQVKVYGDGTFEVPLQHTIPVGRYVISLNFRNEGYSKDVDDCFTIIVK